MSIFNAQILTPNGSLFEGEVSGVKLPGTQGSFEVKANHAPIVSTLEKGNVLVRKADGNTTYAISGGFVEVNNNKLTLLAESVEEA
ncbi:MAG: ATP synthase F1 subunit epsilon [Gracilimonas sp.]|uniref:ATP synthase F1 subunit epsilon n=1 Tax=Gracilimonas sp. TaxID=1974203 RepID=UPI001983CD0F|nr:ATP synthase F1 subunit epsilon [Gracilimonas sp.]MBD3615899.1 ATP synthase F1 subunit epsilon [Gracilimonas sp.]